MGRWVLGGVSGNTDTGYTKRATSHRSLHGQALKVVKEGTMQRVRWTKIRSFQTLDKLGLRDWVRS